MRMKAVNIISSVLAVILLVLFIIIGKSVVFGNDDTTEISSISEEPISSEEESVPIESAVSFKPSQSSEDNTSSEINQSEEPVNDAVEPPASQDTVQYSSNCLFIGDSRTVGLYEYARIEGADYFATVGMSVYNAEKESVNISGLGKTGLHNLLEKRKYAKIHLMLGVNELGYNRQTTLEKYHGIITKIREVQPEATVYIAANLHVGASRSNRDSVVNNANINSFNSEIAKYADNVKFFYIDVNEIFDDPGGNLASEYTSDGVHIYARYYQNWVNWLATKGVCE